jgi:hypothetical protein
MSLLIIWPLLFIEAFLPGWVLLRGFSNCEEEEAAALAIPTTVLSVGLLGVIALILNIPPLLAAWLSLLIPLVVGLLAMTRCECNLIPTNREVRRLLFVWFGAASALLGLQCLIPFYTGGGWFYDWVLSFQISSWYGKHGDLEATFFTVYNPISRPPFFYILCGGAMTRWFGDFTMYQLQATVLNSSLFIAVWYWVRQLPSRRKWLLLTAFWLLPVVAINLLYPWPKGLACGLTLLGLYYFKQWRCESKVYDGALAALLFGVSYACHQLVVAYLVGAGFLLLAGWKNLNRRRLLHAVIGCIIILAISLPWWGWSMHHYGAKKTFSSSPVLTRIKDKSMDEMLVTRMYNLGGLVVPSNAIKAIQGEANNPPSVLPTWIEALQSVWRGTLWGNVGLSSILTLLVCIVFLRRKWQLGWPGWPFVMVVVAFAVLVQPLRESGGLAQVALLPLSLLLFISIARQLTIETQKIEAFWTFGLGLEFCVAVLVWIIFLNLAGPDQDDLNRRVAQAMGVHHLRELSNFGLAAGILILSGICSILIAFRQKAVDIESDNGI